MRSQCNAIHKTIVEQFKHAIVYGQSVKHQPQRVGLSHELADEDISKSSKDYAACPNLTASSHDHQTMRVLKETSGQECIVLESSAALLIQWASQCQQYSCPSI